MWTASSQGFRRCRPSRVSIAPIPARSGLSSSISRTRLRTCRTAFRPYFEVTALEANSDPNQIYELEARLRTFGILDSDEIDRFAETFYKGALDAHDRARFEGLVRQAVARFEQEDDEGRQEEFRQLVRELHAILQLCCAGGPA